MGDPQAAARDRQLRVLFGVFMGGNVSIISLNHAKM
jgi:hypothetical protein